MRKLFIAAAATAAIAAVSGSAFAAGLNGVYVGAALGGSGGNAATVLSAIPGTYNMGGNGITGGGFVGWGTTLGGNVYYGIEGAFDTSTLAAKDPSARVEYPVNAAVGGRLGYELMQNAMIYGAASFVETAGRATSLGVNSLKQDKWAPGYRLGGGVELSLTQNVFTRISYDVTVDEVTYATLGAKVNDTTQTGKISLGYRF